MHQKQPSSPRAARSAACKEGLLCLTTCDKVMYRRAILLEAAMSSLIERKRFYLFAYLSTYLSTFLSTFLYLPLVISSLI